VIVDPLRSARRSDIGWLLPLLGPVVFAGAAAVAAALFVSVESIPPASTILAVLVLLAVSVVAEALPVPIEAVHVGATSLSTIFIAATAVLYGWAPAILTAASAMAVVEFAHRRPPTRIAYNTALYALSAAAAGLVVELFARIDELPLLLVAAVTATGAFYLVDISLLAAIVARSSRLPYGSLVARYLRTTVLPASIMVSITVILVEIWDRSPPTAAALIGPLAAILLYRRSANREQVSMRLARTDPLTAIGNRRGFNERLEQEINAARTADTPVAVCLLDVDNFKAINDTHGHAAGNIVLQDVSTRLRRSGEAFRLGGDEFALVLPRCDAEQAALIAEAVVKRIHSGGYASIGLLAASAGVAAYPEHATEAAELERLADHALYSSKQQGKNQVATYQPDST
jgi:diguanylate cyclase (GGDEF)-like protein